MTTSPPDRVVVRAFPPPRSIECSFHGGSLILRHDYFAGGIWLVPEQAIRLGEAMMEWGRRASAERS